MREGGGGGRIGREIRYVHKETPLSFVQDRGFH